MWDLTLHPLWSPVSSLTLVPFSNRCGTSYSKPPSGPAFLLAHRLVSTSLGVSASSLAHRPMFSLALVSFPIDVGPPIHPLSGPAFLLAHHLVSTSLGDSAYSLTHRPVSDPDTICNGQATASTYSLL